jgi:hypothetical protein
MHLITEQQYASAIGDIFGAEIKNLPLLPPLRRTDGLVAVGAGTALITPGVLEIFRTAGRSIATQVVDESHRDALPCKPGNPKQPDDGCARMVVGKIGRFLYRRTLTPEETATNVATARAAADKYHDFYSGLSAALAGMLVSPQFLYFVERVEPDPNHAGLQRLDGPSKAARLSLLLWDSPPDDALLQAAETGQINTPEGLKRQVDRLLSSPRLEAGVRAFFDDMWVLETFGNLTKDSVIYPAFTVKVANEAREQTLRILVDHLLTRQGDYRDLFTTRHIFLTQDLGTIYRLPVQAAGPLDWVPYDLPENDPRAGILTQAGFLAANAHPGRSSATKRGKALREILMCQKVPDPPPNVDFSALDTPDPKLHTARERLTVHRTNPVCAGCHKITDPIGLALENFDGASQYRATEKGFPIDAGGTLGQASFSDAKGLGFAVRNDPAIPSCLVRRVFQYAVKRQIAPGEMVLIGYLRDRFAEENFRLIPLLRALATNEALYRVSSDTLVSSN